MKKCNDVIMEEGRYYHYLAQEILEKIGCPLTTERLIQAKRFVQTMDTLDLEIQQLSTFF